MVDSASHFKGKHRSDRHKGFTLVELVVVVVVLAILATIGVIAYQLIINDARDSDRASKATQLAESLEKYYQRNGEYPACSQLTGSPESVVSVLTGLDKNALIAPGAVAGTTNSITCSDLTSTTGPDVFSYTGNASNWTLKYKSEGKNQVVSVASRAVAPPPTTPTPPTTVTLACPANFVTIQANANLGTAAFCVMKYEAKNVSSVATSTAAGTPWVSITQPNAVTASQGACTGCHLLTELEWMAIAADVISVPSNWVSGTVGSGSMFTGHTDNSPASRQAANADDAQGYHLTGQTSGTQRRTLNLSNGQVIWDISGNVAEFTTSSLTGSGNYPGNPSQSGFQYYEWNDPALNFRGLPATSLPSAISAQVGTWSSAQGIGRLYTSYNGSNASVFVRGGSYTATSTGTFAFANDAGVLSLYLGLNSGSSSGSMFGFRAAMTP